MIIGFALALLTLAALNYCLSRSPLYPPFAFCAVWAVVVAGLELVRDLYYPVTPATLWIYLTGAVSFSVGGLIAHLLKLSPPVIKTETGMPAYLDWILNSVLVLAILLLPLYWNHIKELAGGGGANFWKQLRLATLAFEDYDEPNSNGFNFVVSLTPFFTIIATVAVFEFFRAGVGALRTCALVMVALVYQLGSTARSQVLLLLVGLFSCIWFRSPRRAAKWALLGFIGFGSLFIANQIQMEKVGARSDASILENLPSLMQGIELYSEGSLVAFEGTLHNPGAVPNNFKLYRYFIRTLDKVGFGIELPSAFSKYAPISPDVDVNVYTIYFSYFSEYGILGTIILLTLLGFVTTLIFRKALTNSPQAVLLFGPAMYGVLMTFFAEAFFSELGFWIKVVFVGFVLYSLLPRLLDARHNLFLPRAVPS